MPGRRRRSAERLGIFGSAFVAVVALVALQIAPAAMAGPANYPVPANAVVVSGRPSLLGRVLVNSSGFSLYGFSGDAAPTPVTSCVPANVAPSGLACTSAWIPLLASGPLVAGPGVRAKGLGQLTRGAITQVTYFGQPLYTFIKDTAAGQMNGQDVTAFHGFFRLVSVDGKPAADRATVGLELSTDGPVLKTTTAGATPRTLYNLTSDPPGGTACTAACTAFWPPLLTNRMPATGPGVDRDAIGLLRRPEGTLQVTFFGEPIYLYAFDLGAGQPGGQVNGNDNIDPNAKGVWYSLASNGMSNAGAVPVESETAGAQSLVAASAVSSGGTTATLYTFSLDTTGAECSGTCARFWPPLLTTAPPVAGPGVTATLVGAIQRPDGSFQVTYAGHPLYLFSQALNPTTAGEGITAFGGTFKVLTVAGAVS
jgi:predicted lipoprotein with Yx(FWY)xxD motif